MAASTSKNFFRSTKNWRRDAKFSVRASDRETPCSWHMPSVRLTSATRCIQKLRCTNFFRYSRPGHLDESRYTFVIGYMMSAAKRRHSPLAIKLKTSPPECEIVECDLTGRRFFELSKISKSDLGSVLEEQASYKAKTQNRL